MNEDTQPTPVEAYGRSKLEAESIVRASRIPFTIVRPCAVYGPWDRDFLAMFRLARRGIAIHPGNRDHWLSIAHVDDIAEGVCLAAASDVAAGRTYFLGDDQPRQWRELFTLAARTAGRELAVDVEVPGAIVRGAARLGSAIARATGRAGLVTVEKVALSRPRYWLCSSARARHDLNFSPRVSLQAGFASTYHWYLDHHWL